LRLRSKYSFFAPLALCLTAVLLLAFFARLSPAQAALYRRGSSGDEVRQIQQVLIRWGYLSGEADGIYGSRTEAAVRDFQAANGLNADGICGPLTLTELGLGSSQADEGNAGLTAGRDNDLSLLARIISAEARGESYEGQVAVGAVVLNRVKHPSFPDTISGVIYQPGAFTALTDGQWNQAVAESARRAATDALNGWDPTGGAIYYYNPKKTSSQWMLSRPVIKVIGEHIFAQ